MGPPVLVLVPGPQGLPGVHRQADVLQVPHPEGDMEVTGHRKWEEIRDQGPLTPEQAAARIRARERLDRHLRYYRHWEAVKRRLGIKRGPDTD